MAFQAQRADVQTVLVDGRLVKHEHRLVGVDLGRARREVERTAEYLVETMGRDVWTKGMNPHVPETKVGEDPYTYTDWEAGSAQPGD
ncbi:hypothetical protein [Plantactinospora endophytica]|uniref:Uncharacterized protein n=1 Tax=Plantactinospora endophytica TaxID=673535 RepID=A0ABQ4E1B1_9ACTN|nr:hypothetical protein [Plantactinospora endophytica]GIG88514.1 hypothetical protein Pen02_34500 [Plantactinospora endophytica]